MFGQMNIDSFRILRLGWWLLSCLFLAGVSSSVSASTSPAVVDSGKAAATLHKETRVVSSKAPLVRVINPYGDVRLRFGGYSSDMEIVSVKQNLDGDLTLIITTDANTDLIEVKPASPSIQPQKSRLDVVVMVPLGKAVNVKTTSGLVEARGLRAPLTVQTDAGRVRLNKNKAAINVKTNSGDIAAVLLKDVTKKPQTFSSVTGAVEVWVAENDTVTAHLETSGDLITHFSLEVERVPHAEPDKKAIATINGGGHVVKLNSRRGQVAIRAYPASR